MTWLSTSAAPAEFGSDADGSTLAALLPALQRLDHLLQAAAAKVPSVYGAESAADPFRGLHISDGEVQRLLVRSPLLPTLNADGAAADGEARQPDAGTRLAWLARSCGLTDFDMDVILIALAPELDLRYERLYAYLQDDVTRRRATVDLALNLLCSSAAERISRCDRFAADAPLVRHGLLDLIPDPNQIRPPLLTHYLKVDEQVVRLLLGQPGLDSRLTSFAELVGPAASADASSLPIEIQRVLAALTRDTGLGRAPMHLYFQGPHGAGKRRAAEALAGAMGARLLVVDLSRIFDKPDFDPALRLSLRVARLTRAVVYVQGLDELRRSDATASWQSLHAALGRHDGVAIAAGRQPWASAATTGTAFLTVLFDIPAFAVRRSCWQAGLAQGGFAARDEDLEALAGRFRLTPGQINAAIDEARHLARWRAAQAEDASGSADPTIQDLFAAARAQSGHELTKLARRIEPKYGWDDIVLPAEPLAQLREICTQAYYRHVVYGTWGFDRKLSLGKGLNVLFSGPPGTGKTMAAEVIARDLQVDLYKIDLSRVINKYIGETEKNLDRIFVTAEDSNAILFFDEADALFGKRSEVRDSHDRYANIEISHLLQKMEEYQGISILATNLRQNLDEAFVRRLQAIVEFPFPDEAYRRRIWENTFPQEAPLGDDVKLDVLAREVRLAGGNIKNMALAAAFYAAADGGVIRTAHLIQAAHREHQKLARSWDGIALSKQQTLQS